mgnify:CR=1 FL=1
MNDVYEEKETYSKNAASGHLAQYLYASEKRFGT